MQKLWVLVATGMGAVLIAGCATYEKGGKSMSVSVKREGTKVLISGVPDIKMTKNWMRLRGMEILLRHRGEQPTFDDLLVHSGEAFHLCHGTKWELRTGLCMSTDPWANLAETYGHAWRWTPPSWWHSMKSLRMEDRWGKSNAFLDELWKSVDAGRPALLGGAYGLCGTWRVVVGYDRHNKKVCYAGAEKPYEWTDLIDEKVKKIGFWDMQVRGPVDPKKFGYGGWLTNAAFLLGEKQANPTEKEKTLMALRRAVAMFRAKPFTARWYGGVTYHFGERAYEALAKDLHELDYPADLKKKRPKLPEIYDMSHLWGQVHQIVVGRAAAAAFCERAAMLLPRARPHLLATTEAYNEEVAIAKKAFAPFIGDYDATKKPREAWLADEKNREAGAAAIRKMLEKERTAIAAIEKALATVEQKQEGVTVSGKPDYSKLNFKGNGHTQDSFSLAVQAAGRLLGKRPDYETIYCLSSNAFSPAIDLGENCTAWWHVQGWQGDKAMEAVASRIGLRAERLELPPDNLSPKDSKAVFERKALEHRKACAKLLREKIDAGAVVLTSGGWKVRTKEGFAPWCWWGIITKATDDGDIRGACLGASPGRAVGFRDRPLDYLGHCWALSPAKPALTAHQADLKMLEQAVARIRGKGPFKADKRTTYGLDAMDEWVKQMAKVPFCTSCAHAGPKGMAGCAVNNAQTTLAGARVAASYLRKRKGALPDKAQPHLEAAAKHYDRIVELLKPATWGFYRRVLNDAEKQKAHAENAFRPVKAALAAAADAMEKALAAEKGWDLGSKRR